MDFLFVSGNHALDLVGTVGRWRTDQVDLLDSPAQLARWFEGSGVVDHAPDLRAEDLERARQLRAAVFRLAVATLADGPVAARDRAVVNAMAEAPPAALHLRADGGVQRHGDGTAALSTVARSALELFGGPERALMRECEAEGCTRLYVDHSARRSRRWCDMRLCGNRAKVAAFRRRQAAVE